MTTRCANKAVNILYHTMINEYETENNNAILSQYILKIGYKRFNQIFSTLELKPENN